MIANKIWYSAIILIFLIISPANAEIESPRSQMENGVPPEEIQCDVNLELVIRSSGAPACVKHTTIEAMLERGIALIVPVASKPTTSEQPVVQSQPITQEQSPTIISKNKIQTIPASGMSVINFYIIDHDLNLAHNGIETVSTEGLFEFAINGIQIKGPKSMIETGPDTGQFYLILELPETINGKPIKQDDIVTIKYLDKSDFSGSQRTTTESLHLTSTFAKIEAIGNGKSKIGHHFTVRIYESDRNRDSQDEDKISLNELEFRTENRIKATLSHPKFDANSRYLIETGRNTGIFEVQIKIPREIDDATIHIGYEYEIKYIDRANPADIDEEVVLKGKIGSG